MAKRSLPRHKRRASGLQRRKSRLVKIGEREYELIDGCLHVEGHRLERRQIEHFKEAVAYRARLAEQPNSGIKHPRNYAYDVGLSDVLWKYRPSKAETSEERLSSLVSELGRLALSIGDMRSYAFYAGGVVTEEGCKLLNRLADEAERRVALIRHFTESMATEGSTKLQDWIKREEEFNRLRGAQS